MPKKYHMSWDEALKKLEAFDLPDRCVYGIPKGGMILSAFLKNAKAVYRPEDASYLIDDIVDSGSTKKKYNWKYGLQTFALIDKTKGDKIPDGCDWVVFPWEDDKEDDIHDNIIRILEWYKRPVSDKIVKSLKLRIECNLQIMFDSKGGWD